MGPVVPFTSTTHPWNSAELGYICYLPLASLFPTLIPPLRLKPHPSPSCITQLWTWDKWKGGLFFSPQFSEMKITSRSYPKFLSVLGLRKRGPVFIDFILSRCSSCICFCFLKREGGGDRRWKLERQTMLVYCWLAILFSSSILLFSSFLFLFSKMSSLYLFYAIADVSVRWWMWERAERLLLDLVKGHCSPRSLLVWRDPSFASKWKLCLKLGEEINFIGAVGYNYCITTQIKNLGANG